jgi:hypothetical protein
MNRIALLVVGGLVALASVTAATAGVQALITGAQIKDGTVASRDIRNGTIGRADIAPAALSSLRGQTGAPGPAGPQGQQGPVGPAGPAAQIEYTAVYSAPAVVAPGQSGFAVALCPPDTVAFSPGQHLENVSAGRLALMESFPVAAAEGRSGWQVTMLNVGTSAATFTARAYCLRGARFFAP